jgi:hypothetical protein
MNDILKSRAATLFRRPASETTPSQVYGLESISIDEAVARERFPKLSAEYLTCRNFQFGAQMFPAVGLKGSGRREVRSKRRVITPDFSEQTSDLRNSFRKAQLSEPK